MSNFAEKLGRLWITCDIGKLSFHTTQKRILQIKNSRDLNKPTKKCDKDARAFITLSFDEDNLSNAVNHLDKSIYSFNIPPALQRQVTVSDEEVIITIDSFVSEELCSTKITQEKKLTGFDLLSAVFIDKNYNGKQFITTDAFFLDEIKRDNNTLVIKLDRKNMGNKLMLVYTDIFGNELAECVTI